MLESIAATTPAPTRSAWSPATPSSSCGASPTLADGQAIEYYEARHRGDRTVLEVDLVRQRPA
jgi:hypothetical protein